MKGIILAGGSGTRLFPITTCSIKQLLPVYDKPMIYYPLAVLMQAGIRDILIISTEEDTPRMEKALGDGKDFGINLPYMVQEKPNGIAESFIIGEKFIKNSKVCLVLGDNIFYGANFYNQLKEASKLQNGATVFGYKVSDPERYGVVEFEAKSQEVKRIVEKPKEYISSYAITGLYFFDETVSAKAKTLKPSHRGELEITDIQNLYLKEKNLKVNIIEQGTAWLDAGTFDSLLDASLYVQVIEKRQGIKIACLEEIALQNGWITKQDISSKITDPNKNSYIRYISQLTTDTSSN